MWPARLESGGYNSDSGSERSTATEWSRAEAGEAEDGAVEQRQ